MLRHIGGLALLLLVTGCGTLGGSPATPVSASLKELVNKPRPDATTILRAADASRDEGRYNEALQIYQELIVNDPSLTAGQLGVAECMLALGKPAEAKSLFDALVPNAEFHAVALQGKGLSMLALGMREPSAKALREATGVDPSLWRSWNALAVIADLKQEPEEAQAFYEKARALNPDSATIINNIGYSKLINGDPSRAIAEFRKALALDPTSETIQNNMRLALAAKGEYADALRATPKDRLPAVLNNVGYIAMQRGDYAAAEGYLARAIEGSSSFNTIATTNLDQLRAHQGAAR
jgi:Flp pilus assembly protein TadD